VWCIVEWRAGTSPHFAHLLALYGRLVPQEPLENVDYSLIVASLQPLLDLVEAFVGEAQRVSNSRAGLPSADCQMMADIANESEFVHEELMEEPIETIAMTATLSCVTGMESLASLVRLIVTGPPPPIFSADVLCRSSIDGSRPCWWLTEPGLPPTQRVQRIVAESLYSATEMGHVKSDVRIVARAESMRNRLTRYAAIHSWEIGPNKAIMSVGDQARPTVRQYLESEFGDPVAAHATWSHLSAVTHGTQYGLIQSIDMSSADGGVAIMGTSSDSLSARVEIAATTVAASTMRFFNYMGWTTIELTKLERDLATEIQRRSRDRIAGS